MQQYFNAPLFLFDLDGTLLDTSIDLANAINRVRADEGLPSLPVDSLAPHAFEGSPALLQAGFGIDPDHERYDALRQRFLFHYKTDGYRFTRPYPGVIDLLHRLRDAGIRIGVVTNKHEQLARDVLKGLELHSLFATVIGSDRPGCALKPSPSMLQLALEEVGSLPARTVYAGDDPKDVLAAHAAGLLCAACLWSRPRSLAHPQADFVARAPERLFTWAEECFRPKL